MTDVNNLEEFIERNTSNTGDYFGTTLQEIITLRSLCNAAIIQRLEESVPTIYKPIFSENV